MAEVHPPLVHNGTLSQPDANPNPSQTVASSKKSKETKRRRRRRKQKKNNKTAYASATDESGADTADNSQPQKVVEQVIIEYVPEKAEIDGIMDEEFRKIFKKFSFTQPVASEETEKKDEATENAISNKKNDSDSDQEDHDDQQKEKGVSNKKKKLERRIKIAELKQISSRPDVVEAVS